MTKVESQTNTYKDITRKDQYEGYRPKSLRKEYENP